MSYCTTKLCSVRLSFCFRRISVINSREALWEFPNQFCMIYIYCGKSTLVVSIENLLPCFAITSMWRLCKLLLVNWQLVDPCLGRLNSWRCANVFAKMHLWHILIYRALNRIIASDYSNYKVCIYYITFLYIIKLILCPKIKGIKFKERKKPITVANSGIQI